MERCKIVCDIGVNWGGYMDLAKKMIHEAKACGADYVKFQWYDPHKLLEQKNFTDDDWLWTINCKLDKQRVRELYYRCQKVGVGFAISVFDFERWGLLQEIEGALGELDFYKIAARTPIHMPELTKTILNSGKTTLISLGDTIPIKEMCERYKLFFRRHGNPLYCVSKYPSSERDVGYGLEMGMFKDKGGWSYGSDRAYFGGISNHCPNITPDVVAITYGARYIEKHFTIDRALPGPDQSSSLNSEALGALCNFRDCFYEMKKEEEGEDNGTKEECHRQEV